MRATFPSTSNIPKYGNNHKKIDLKATLDLVFLDWEASTSNLFIFELIFFSFFFTNSKLSKEECRGLKLDICLPLELTLNLDFNSLSSKVELAISDRDSSTDETGISLD